MGFTAGALTRSLYGSSDDALRSGRSRSVDEPATRMVIVRENILEMIHTLVPPSRGLSLAADLLLFPDVCIAPGVLLHYFGFHHHFVKMPMLLSCNLSCYFWHNQVLVVLICTLLLVLSCSRCRAMMIRPW